MPQAHAQAQQTPLHQRDASNVHTLPLQTRDAALQPTTYNKASNTVDCVWTTGSMVRRYDWFNDTAYDEVLDITPDAVDMTRFEAGTLQVLDGHDMYSGVSAIIGIAESGAIADGQGTATLRLSQRPEMAGIVSDIAAGIIRAMSFGYSVQLYEVTPASMRTDGGTVPIYTARRWQPQELSYVPVGADPNAGTRAAQAQAAAAGQRADAHRTAPAGQPCEFVFMSTRAAAQTSPQKETTMPQANTQGGASATGADNAAATANGTDEQTRAAAAAQQGAAGAGAVQATQGNATAAFLTVQEATQRAADITDLCTRHGLGAMAAKFIRDNADMVTVQAAVIAELARADGAAGGNVNVRGNVTTVRDEYETKLRGIENAIANRISTKVELDDNGRQYRGLSLLEIGRDFLASRGINTRGMDRMRIAGHMLQFRSPGMLGTSDFANLLANVANKRLRQAYQENPGSYTRWARKAPNAPDFKSMSVIQLGGMPDLLKVNEAGEFKYGAVTDGAESYALLTYGRIVSFSRQAIVNDDLRGFDRLVAGFGGSAARLENRTVYAQLTANANMADGGALFNATAVTTAGGHANYATGAGSALQFSSLVTMRGSMRVQKGYQSEELNLVPAYLIVPAALEQTAYQLTSANYTPTTQANISEFKAGGKTALDPVVEPVLDANSATAWYAAAENSQVDTVEYCYLDGAEGPMIDSEIGFDTDGISYKCRLDFAAKAIDFRGLYKSAGA